MTSTSVWLFDAGADFDDVGRVSGWDRTHILATDAEQSRVDQLTEAMSR